MISYKKVGGLHHWKLGRLGGSFYLKASERKRMNIDWFGVSACFVLAISLFTA